MIVSDPVTDTVAIAITNHDPACAVYILMRVFIKPVAEFIRIGLDFVSYLYLIHQTEYSQEHFMDKPQEIWLLLPPDPYLTTQSYCTAYCSNPDK